MDYLSNAVYAILFASTILITMFNFLYSYRVRKLNYNLGIQAQGVIRVALEINVALALFGAAIIALLVLKA